MRSLRLLAIPLFLALLLLLPSPPRVYSQGCTTVPSFAGGGTIWLASDNGISDPNGYQFRQLSGESDSIQVQQFSGSWVTIGLLEPTFNTITSSNPLRLINNADEASFEYCPPAGTPTPTVTSTPTVTPTPTEVIVTVTPSPTPTPNPAIALQERVDQTFSLQVFGFTVMLGIAIYLFLRLR